ncbi:MAG: hypothetical protein ACLUD1_00835 [Clostridia bacterium]
MFFDKLWPDFTEKDLDETIENIKDETANLGQNKNNKRKTKGEPRNGYKKISTALLDFH